MTHDETKRIFDELDDLLDAERTALLTGRIEEVGRLQDRKSRLIDSLSNDPGHTTFDPRDLQKKIERNQGLLDAATDGIRSVARRLAAIRRVRESLETYDARGQRRSVEVASASTLEKRA